jgi:uncharacterized protein YdeI (YjbR/CyaY-like superfamily)
VPPSKRRRPTATNAAAAKTKTRAPDASAIHEFHDVRAWEKWLERHHATSDGVWLRLQRKTPTTTPVSRGDALDVALCYGWIDGQARSEDDRHWLQRFTPRRPRSMWSKINREKVAALVAAGRMRPAGLAEIERAKRDGRWDAAYDAPSKATVPADLQAALDASPRAKAFFATLDSRNRFAILFRTHQAKRPETRARRIAAFVAMLAKKQTIHPTKSG